MLTVAAHGAPCVQAEGLHLIHRHVGHLGGNQLVIDPRHEYCTKKPTSAPPEATRSIAAVAFSTTWMLRARPRPFGSTFCRNSNEAREPPSATANCSRRALPTICPNFTTAMSLFLVTIHSPSQASVRITTSFFAASILSSAHRSSMSS